MSQDVDRENACQVTRHIARDYTVIQEFYSPFSRDKIFGSIEHAFSYKWKGIGYAHPHSEKEAETAIHWARLGAKNDPIPLPYSPFLTTNGTKIIHHT